MATKRTRLSRAVLLAALVAAGAALCALSLSRSLEGQGGSGVSVFGPTPVGAVDLEGFAEEDDADLAFSADDDGFEAPLAEDGELETTEEKAGSSSASDPSTKPFNEKKKKKTSKPAAPYVPWKERDSKYWIKLFDDFAKVVVHEHKVELLLLVLAGLYALNFVIGSRKNESVVLEWANTFGLPVESTGSGPATVYGRNFALVGVDTKTSSSEIIFRESQSCFKCYASGRRYVNWVMTTLELRKRQDLMSELVNLVMPSKDKVIIEVSMNESNMHPMVFAIVKKKLSKAFISEHKDVKKYTRVVTDPQGVLAANKATCHFAWPKKKLVVLSESKDLFSSMMSETAMRNVFDQKVYMKGFEKYFESMYVTTEGPVPGTEPTKNLVRFEFSLPSDTKKMSELEDLMELVFHEIDVIGSHKLSPEALKKANQRRKEVEEELFKESLAQRQEAAQHKREVKYQKEKASMTTAQAAKADEKRKNKLLKKNRPKMKMMK